MVPHVYLMWLRYQSWRKLVQSKIVYDYFNPEIGKKKYSSVAISFRKLQ